METGVFESINSCNGPNNKFENTTSRFYRFKSMDNNNLEKLTNGKSNNKENNVPQSTETKNSKLQNYCEIASLRKMLDYLREKPKITENSRHNCSMCTNQ